MGRTWAPKIKLQNKITSSQWPRHCGHSENLEFMPKTISKISAEKLASFSTRLKKKQEELNDRINQLEQKELPQLYKNEETNDGYGDDAKNDQIRQRMVEQIKRMHSQLLEVEAALHRIEDGTFGLDEITGDPIDIKRLEAYPTARRNI